MGKSNFKAAVETLGKDLLLQTRYYLYRSV